MTQLTEHIKNQIRTLQDKPIDLPEGDELYDYVGSNIDDAYSMGEDHGYNAGRLEVYAHLLKLIEDKGYTT